MGDIINKQFGDNLEFKHPVCKDCRGKEFTVEISENDDIILHCVNCGNAIDFQNIRQLQAERDAAIKEIGRIGRELGACQAERDRLKAVLVKISEWGCNGQCYELVKTLCPCCIAKQALEVDGGKD